MYLLQKELSDYPPCEFAAENYWEVYANWLEGKFSGGWVSVEDKEPGNLESVLVYGLVNSNIYIYGQELFFRNESNNPLATLTLTTNNKVNQ